MPYQLLPWAIGLPVLLGSLNGKVTKDNVNTWYPTLKQPPPGPPPRWVFPVVWTSLYAGMGWAAHIAVKALDTSPHLSVRKAASNALVLWYAQFAINMAWTPLFFGAKKTGLAAVDILALWGTVAACTVEMAKVDERTVYVFVPYLCWLFYASYLNIGVWYLNGGNKKIDKYTQDGKDKLQDGKDKLQ